MSKNKLWLLIAIIAIGLIGTASIAFAHDSVTLKDHDGNVIQGGSTVPYSPKQTCGECHNYESNVAHAIKDHGEGSPSYGNPYSVPYPRNGVSAGYHFHQGRNTSWGDTQRNYYGLQSFTMSAGMYGKY